MSQQHGVGCCREPRSEEKQSTYIDVVIPMTEYSAVMEAVNSL